MEEQTLSSRSVPEQHGGGLSCAQARESARAVLDGLHLPSVVMDNVLIVVSEMVSNADRHAGGATGFQVTAGVCTITVELSDHSTTPPRIQPWAPDEPGGFGWRLVNQLAATDVRIHHGGKTITAVLTFAPTGQL
ncbi:ATP-binding protein [Streptomyces sp. NRRL F-2747]|uniref:ATP-binding protein n=1 Tax=Streptomyces sp. NRRL F-2747 TaxID=1463843 RepID=UPI0004C9C45F|nr:ATP-binding protein [Streptomyces sp. NRRL F-2747]